MAGSASVPPWFTTPLWMPKRPVSSAVRDGRHGVSEAYTLVEADRPRRERVDVRAGAPRVAVAAEVIGAQRVDVEVEEAHSCESTTDRVARKGVVTAPRIPRLGDAIASTERFDSQNQPASQTRGMA